MAARRRLDLELVRRELAPSREVARRLIEDGAVLVSGAVATKVARLVDPGEPVVVTAPPRFVGRGGHKLEAALDGFELDVTGAVALDAGSSTGGFTDCLLQHGAARVVAVDVGRHQLHERLRADDRVDVREQTDVRNLDVTGAGGPFDVVVADLSFISVRSVAAALVGAASSTADLVVLVKPQFEAGRAEVSRGRGVIRDPDVWLAAMEGAMSALDEAGASIMGAMASPLRGADGNVEFLLHAQPAGRGPAATVDLAALVASVAESAPADGQR
jgi:23S rRNA (cytidine1920-2'-O)/16S rRNA (cytidine1409-2'-O)-methyltransferase